MSENNHGRRYSFAEKKEILDYLEKNTYKDTSEKYKISETTLSRWKKAIKSGSKKNSSKIIISLPKFWLEYLNEQIESDAWENYSDAFLSILRDHFRNQKSMQNADSKYLEEVKDIFPTLVNLNLDVDSMLLANSNEVIYKTEQWGSTEGIQNLIKIWKEGARWHQNWINKWKKGAHLRKDWIMQDPYEKNPEKKNIRSFEFQKETYSVRDISVKHLIAVKSGMIPSSPLSRYLIGLKRKLTQSDVYIFAIAKQIEGSSLLLAMDTLKRAAMGSLPPISDRFDEKSLKLMRDMLSSELEAILQRRKDYIEKAQEFIREDPQIIIKEQATGLNRLNSQLKEKYGEEIVENKRLNKSKNHLEEYAVNWSKEKERTFQIKSNPFLMRVANLVNKPLRSEEIEVINLLEKKLGKKIEKITADPEQETSRNELGKIPWHKQDLDFPALKFPCHYLSSNGEIILLTLLNLGLSELPSEILNLKNLKYLNLYSNNLIELPTSFSDLKSLESLVLDNNQFSKVPNSLIDLPKLQNLYMRNNKISKIPIALTDAWQARFKDQFDLGYFSSNCTAKLNFTGNPIKHSSLSKDQIELERGFLLDISIPRPIKALIKK